MSRCWSSVYDLFEPIPHFIIKTLFLYFASTLFARFTPILHALLFLTSITKVPFARRTTLCLRARFPFAATIARVTAYHTAPITSPA